MSQGYWQPIVHCKNPECFFGKPTFLPYPNLPQVAEAQPEWPADDWTSFLICRHGGHGYHYTKADVEWSSSQNKNGLPGTNLVLYVELRCAQKDCALPVKIHLGFDDSMKDRHRDGMLEKGIDGATCEAGHAPAQPRNVIQSKFVNKMA